MTLKILAKKWRNSWTGVDVPLALLELKSVGYNMMLRGSKQIGCPK